MLKFHNFYCIFFSGVELFQHKKQVFLRTTLGGTQHGPPAPSRVLSCHRKRPNFCLKKNQKILWQSDNLIADNFAHLLNLDFAQPFWQEVYCLCRRFPVCTKIKEKHINNICVKNFVLIFVSTSEYAKEFYYDFFFKNIQFHSVVCVRFPPFLSCNKFQFEF